MNVRDGGAVRAVKEDRMSQEPLLSVEGLPNEVDVRTRRRTADLAPFLKEIAPGATLNLRVRVRVASPGPQTTSITVLSADQFDQAVGELDLVLVAQHLGTGFAALASRAGSTPVVLLTSDTHGVAVTEAIAEITARTTTSPVSEGH